MNFIDYLKSLAQKDETMLFVRQTPRLVNNAIEYYADGAPKSTYPAFINPRIKSGESWYVNSGVFIVARFENGKPSARREYIDHVAFMVLDDIGTKSKTPPLTPTWKIETSPGNYQWGYVFSEQPNKFDYSAAIIAVAEAGYSDPGAINPVRNVRLPGSINLKRGKNNFESVLTEFNEGLEYTLEQICDALSVTPGESSSAEYAPIRIKDTGADSVLAWLNDQKLVYSSINNEGWISVHCPNAESHSDGNPEARYKPIDRSFCCFHANCQHLDSRFFCDWVADQGGPRAMPGLRDDLIADYTDKINKLTPTKSFPDEAAARVAETEAKQAGREDRARWHERFAYIVDDDAYFDKDTCSEISRRAFNAIFRHVECTSVGPAGKPRRVEASLWFDEHREARRAYALKGLTYAAGESWLVHKDGLVYGNLWRDARPKVTGGGDVTPWLDHCRRLVPEAAELEHILDVMAFKVQNPRVKINHAVLHGGKGGCGKDTMWAPFIWSVCGPHEKNKGLIDNDSLSSQWGYQLEAEIVVLNELKEPNAADRRVLANRLKPIIAAPPEMLSINRKGLHPYDMVNRIFMLAFTNEDMPITLDSDDRRWFCVWSDAPKMTYDAAAALWGWYKAGGFEAVAAWLHTRDVSRFGPQAMPPMTEYKQKLIYVGMSSAEGYVYHEIEAGRAPFNADVIAGPWHTLCKTLTEGTNNSVRVVQPALFHALKEAGWIDKGLCHATDFPSKKHCFVRPALRHWSRSDVRRELARITGEGREAPNVVAIKG